MDRVSCGVSSQARASLVVGSTTLSLSSARRWIYDPQPRENFATHQPDWKCGTAPPLEPLEKRDQKLYLQPTCNNTGRRNLHEQLGHEPCSGETAGDQEGDT